MSANKPDQQNLDGIAIVGMAGKFPGVENITEYWDAISQGKELLKRFTDEELSSKGVSESSRKHQHFVPVNGLIHTAELFDASFFGFTPREADLTDPQHRKFLEVCYEALEHAGQAPDNPKGPVGVFAGCSMNNYLLKNLLQYPELLKNNGEFQTIVNNDKDFLTTKVSYKLNLTGPSFDIQTACSTSLVAIHVACQNLLNYQCDVALGGGAFIMNPRGHGYMFKPGGIESAVGTCRPFDKDAEGTVFGEGVGVVVLKRLEDAVADNDEIWAVIKSSAINNDGSFKIGYMAPSADGQAEAISMAMQFGNINPRTISYVEAHGTGTNLGDPIEIKGLTKVFREYTQDTQFCAIGSVKGNMGHCDVAAGVAGIIKTAMALKYKKLPPSINYNTANPELELDTSPFYVNTALQNWEVDGVPRRAALSSFGIGGTNAHCILEEWADNAPQPSENEIHLLPLTAKKVPALEKLSSNLVEHVKQTQQEIADIAHTLQTGRNFYAHRTLLVGRNKQELIRNFEDHAAAAAYSGKQEFSDPSVVFMFTGQGSQYVNMSKGLYESFDLYKNIIDEADAYLTRNFDLPLLELLFGDESDERQAKVNLTSNTQPLLFAVQYATACLLIEFGIFPNALTGHSIGEITAATLAGVLDFEDALFLVATRGKIMQAQNPGAMLSVNLPASQLLPLLPENIELALENAPGYSVVSGTKEAIADFEKHLNNTVENLHTTLLKTSHAFHSSLMEPALAPFVEALRNIQFNEPEIPFISNVTGTWITKEQAMSPDYWADHIRSTVKFSTGIQEIFQSEYEVIFMEVGPGNSLSMLLSQFETSSTFKCISTIRHPRTKANDVHTLYHAVSEYWVSGGFIDWDTIYGDEKRFKVPLPAYPFEQNRHWLEPKIIQNIYVDGGAESVQQAPPAKTEEIPVKQEKQTSAVALHPRPQLSTAYVAPNTSVENTIVAIWQPLLGIEGIGIHDDFFELGGHSLLASQLMVRMNEQFQVKLPLDSIFKHPTIHKLSTGFQLKEKSGESGNDIEKSTHAEFFPLSNEQKRLWLIHKIDGNNPSYNIPFTYVLNGPIDVEILNKSFQLLTERHKALKSYITTKNGEPVCGLHTKDFKLQFRDLTGGDPSGEAVQNILGEETRKTFNLAKDPLIRVTLLKVAAEKFIFHLTVQHIVFDGWSWGIFSKEIGQIYNDLVQGKNISLPPQEFQYADFSVWQEKHPNEINNPDSIQFWKKQLNGIPVETKFPFDHKRPHAISGKGGREGIELDADLTEKLKGIGKQADTTLFMTMLTAFGALLNVYSNEEDICIGTPTGNRIRSQFENMIGFFVNTIVFRFKMNRSLSFNKLLQQHRQVIIDSLDHQDASFEKVVDALQPQRVMNINPLFQIMFAWQNAPRPPLAFNQVEGERMVVKNGISPLDITFYMWEEKGRILGEIEFNADLLDRETVVHLKHNYICLLEQISNHLETPVKELTLISEYSSKALSRFNKTDAPLPAQRLHEMFEQTVATYPHKEAVVSGKNRLSYKEVNDKANKLAHSLIKQNVQGSFVGVSLPRTEQMLITILAVLKAGANYLPLDPDFPDDRLKYIIKDSGAQLLITNKELKEKFAGCDTSILLVDAGGLFDFNLFAKTYDNPALEIPANALAYTIYTSGSTGNPKGVKVPHSAAVNFIQSMSKKPGMTADDKLLAVTTLSFDISVLEMFLPISVGGTVVIADSAEVSNGKSLSTLLEKEKITLLQATPATWNVLLLSGWNGDKNLKALCGGEAIQPRLIKDLLPKVGQLWNMYGPTETTVWSTCFQITNADAPVWVGTPIDNTQIYILDKENKELPVGVIGEVGIGGDGVTSGYHNREELTNEKFIRINDKIVYKTGDGGRVLTNGQLELAGRLDNQIKLRGYRIEPGEIETLIGKYPGVKEVVVKVQKFEDLDERLIAYLTTDDGKSLNTKQLAASLKSRLPKYMVPSDFLVIAEFAKTPNGKIDKKALDYFSVEAKEKPKSKEVTEVQKALLRIWTKTLHRDSIDVEDTFFDIGGHSLLAVKMIEAVNKKFKVNLDLIKFFENPSILNLESMLDAESDTPMTQAKNGKSTNGKVGKRTIEV